jgi:hypothetical protein
MTARGGAASQWTTCAYGSVAMYDETKAWNHQQESFTTHPL